MERSHGNGPAEAPEIGEQSDVGVGAASDHADSPDDDAYTEVETDPLGGTGGVSSGGAG